MSLAQAIWAYMMHSSQFEVLNFEFVLLGVVKVVVLSLELHSLSGDAKGSCRSHCNLFE